MDSSRLFVQQFWEDQIEAAHAEMATIRCGRKDGQVQFMAKLVQGLVDKDSIAFLEGLKRLLSWHRSQVDRPDNHNDPEMYFCVPAVALSILAIRRALLKESDLPDDEYLPMDLLRPSQKL